MNIKKIVLRTVPYVCIALYGTKIGQAWRLAAGTAFAEKFLHWGDGFMQALASPLPSFHPQDVLAGMAIAAGFYAAVYVKGKTQRSFGTMSSTVRRAGGRRRTSNLMSIPHLPITSS